MSNKTTSLIVLAAIAVWASAVPSAVATVSPGVFSPAVGFASGGQEQGPEIDKAKIRYGKIGDVDLTDKTTRIGLVNSKKVYLDIPAYKTIVAEKIERGTARYIKLMEQATTQFRATLEKVAQQKNLKLIVEVGGVSGVRTVDLTDAIIEAL